MKILVTGGAGFIGSHLVDALVDKEHEVVVIDNLSTGKKENLNSAAKFYEIDISDQKIADIFGREKFDIVFHHAAQIDLRKSVADPVFDLQVNVGGSLNLLENCVQHKVKKFIFASTGGAIYGDHEKIPTPESVVAKPTSPYGIAKLTVEHYLYYYNNVHKLDYAVLRYANVYGPRQNSKGEAGVVAIFCDKMLGGKQAVINGDGKQTRDYVYVGDVVRANLLALEKDVCGSYNVGTGVETDVNTIFNELRKAIGAEVEEKHVESKAGEQQRSCLDWGLIKEEMGWEPKVRLEDGLKKVVEFFKKDK